MSKQEIQIHRFRDSMAISAGDGNTTYVDIESAKFLSLKMDECVRDIQSKEFSHSNFNTCTVPCDSEYPKLNVDRNGLEKFTAVVRIWEQDDTSMLTIEAKPNQDSVYEAIICALAEDAIESGAMDSKEDAKEHVINRGFDVCAVMEGDVNNVYRSLPGEAYNLSLS